MLTETLKTLFIRDLAKLKSEIDQYNNEADLWIIKAQIKNSAGNLCLHLVGNLNNYIGKELGGTNYVRNREHEFSLKNIPKEELIAKIDSTIRVVDQTLAGLQESDLASEFPVLVLRKRLPQNTCWFIWRRI